MRILVIEDEHDVIDGIREGLGEDDELVEADSREGAREILGRDQEFDLIVCDLRIPPNSGEGLLADEEHGLAVYQLCREQLPGTPVRFFSGRANLDNIADALSEGGPVNLLGDGTHWRLVRVHQKRHAANFMSELASLRDGLLQLEAAVEVRSPRPLKPMATRAIQVLARQLGASQANVSPAGTEAPGFSGAETLAVRFEDGEGVVRARYFLKVAPRKKIDAELHGFDLYVPTLLTTGFTPRGSVIEHGLRDHSAIAYVLAEGFDRNLFSTLADSQSLATDSLHRLLGVMLPWEPVWRTEVFAIGEMRRRFISDQDLSARRSDSELDEYERQEIALAMSVNHGDLHGANVLTRPDGEPILIDFGDVAVDWHGFDAVTLELSLMFHPASPVLDSGWPTYAQAENFLDLDIYLAACPVADFVRSLRSWALRSVDGNIDSLRALFYTQATRQLKYPDPDHALANAIARGALAGRRS